MPIKRRTRTKPAKRAITPRPFKVGDVVTVRNQRFTLHTQPSSWNSKGKMLKTQGKTGTVVTIDGAIGVRFTKPIGEEWYYKPSELVHRGGAQRVVADRFVVIWD